MKSSLMNRKRRVLGTVLVMALVLLMLFGRRFNPLAVFIVGSWLTSNDSTQTTVTTLKWDGEWEMVTTFKNQKETFPDGSGFYIPLVYKGRYSLYGSTFYLEGVHHYLRNGDKDELWVPCSDWEGHRGECGTHAEILNMEREQFDSKNTFTINSANWWASKMSVHSPWSDVTETWTRQ